jgi:hypothetical protein
VDVVNHVICGHNQTRVKFKFITEYGSFGAIKLCISFYSLLFSVSIFFSAGTTKMYCTTKCCQIDLCMYS